MPSLFSHAPSRDQVADSAAQLVDTGVISERTTPTDRAGTVLQIELVLVAAEMSGPQRAIIASADVARAKNVTSETATQTLRFCATVGLFTGGRGKFAVTEAGWTIAQRWPVDERHAQLLLQDLFLRHWSAQEASRILAPGPVPCRTLAARLQESLPGSSRRGMALVDWLVLVMLVHRDQQDLVWPAPALRAPRDGAALSVPAPSAVMAPAEKDVEELDALMGMTIDEWRALPRERYSAMLMHLSESLNLLTPA